ncbi:DNA (cytosine-5-)-methyltransferase [Anabaena sp. UHCC 0399]|uniref:DNA cytosine methyltransferase n=1 Tax=Anabaena sp. UHCC 0399 TaxID=3110238 RepID=UPI002B20833F|nr:DNA (cytosine-5-)-methyltransferase [Anabaena sp. UHCC 0399]MEA5566171.1 DNA (cytosine-5-)-methyltransferase [Anabaena sp. UHCC 0399]
MQHIEEKTALKFLDLFCGIGGFRIAAEIVCQERNFEPVCVFSSDIDPDAQKAYAANFGEKPAGDITKIDAQEIPEHDILFAGFPCQPFSICGDMKGFDDIRGTLFFEIARILQAKQPQAFILENVKQLKGHNQGQTLRRIIETLSSLGYYTDYRILNALDFGVPQKRDRIFIIGFRNPVDFLWPEGGVPMKPLLQILADEVPDFYYASEKIRNSRIEKRKGKQQYSEMTIWHENKGGNISAYPYSCALRAGASYNYLLVNGERRLTEREMLRLQGFPDSYKIVGSYQAVRKQAGNAVAVPCVAAVIRSVLDAMTKTVTESKILKSNTNRELNVMLEPAASIYTASGA